MFDGAESVCFSYPRCPLFGITSDRTGQILLKN